MATQHSPATSFQRIFGEALGFSSPGFRKNNRRLHWTPGGEHLGEESIDWLQRHQEKAQTRLERKMAAKTKTVYIAPNADAPASARGRSDAGGASSSAAVSNGVLQQLLPLGSSNSVPRMPPLAERGTEPQVLIFEMGVLVERYRATLWDSSLCTAARPGLIDAGRRLRERFLLCAISRAPEAEAVDLLAALRERGLEFDYAFIVPPPEARGRTASASASPLLGEDSMRVLRDAMGMTVRREREGSLCVCSIDGARMC